jgi:hypothetical protein
MQRLKLFFLERPGALLKSMGELTTREKRRLISELSSTRGFMPLLMKPRNKQRWTPEDKRELGSHLRRISAMSPYLVVLVMPGGMLMLPVIAWWLDRRRGRRPAALV